MDKEKTIIDSFENWYLSMPDFDETLLNHKIDGVYSCGEIVSMYSMFKVGYERNRENPPLGMSSECKEFLEGLRLLVDYGKFGNVQSRFIRRGLAEIFGETISEPETIDECKTALLKYLTI